jgi:NADH:ubiquinone oxidoreductase subunit 5 (subunit L)/multisubunit Na+/H+ antiporter MnhA subunit
MAQTLRTLAALLTFAILLTITLGFWSFFTEGEARDKDLFVVHFVAGLATAILALLVHCLIFIYFLGTGRWVKEVTLAYRMPDEPWHKHTRELKRQTFPPALFSMLIAIAAAAAGTAAQLKVWPWYLHMTLGLLTLLINAWAFRIELRNVTINAGIIAEVLHEVDRIRAANGMNSNEEALREEEAPVANGKDSR